MMRAISSQKPVGGLDGLAGWRAGGWVVERVCVEWVPGRLPSVPPTLSPPCPPACLQRTTASCPAAQLWPPPAGKYCALAADLLNQACCANSHTVKSLLVMHALCYH
jgi:hypothetical protein